MGHNGVSIIIPCHRVVGTNGSLTGYAGGIEKKIALLELEHAALAFSPLAGSRCNEAKTYRMTNHRFLGGKQNES